MKLKIDWKELEKKGAGIRLFNGKKTLFYNGETRIWDSSNQTIMAQIFGGAEVWNERSKLSLEVIIILPGVEEIPDSTFANCARVKVVIMHDSLKRIGIKAFHKCFRLEYVSLSKNLEYIGNLAFCGCKLLCAFFVPQSCKCINNEALRDCKNLIILNVPHRAILGEMIIRGTALIEASPFPTDIANTYEGNEKLNFWIKQNSSIHAVCSLENPLFDETKINTDVFFAQDDCGLTALHYLICNQTADYETIETVVLACGKELLHIEDKRGWNSLHYACWIGDLALQKLFVQLGGQKLADSLLQPMKQTELNFMEFRFTSEMKSSILIHSYLHAIHLKEEDHIIDKKVNEFLKNKPSYGDVYTIIKKYGIPKHHRLIFQKYMSTRQVEEMKDAEESGEMIPLMRSTITVVGRGRDGKTSTINSLKGVPFKSYSESTKGSQTSEVNVHDVGIHVTNVDTKVTERVAFQEEERDRNSTIRSVFTQLVASTRQREYCKTFYGDQSNSDNFFLENSKPDPSSRFELKNFESYSTEDLFSIGKNLMQKIYQANKPRRIEQENESKYKSKLCKHTKSEIDDIANNLGNINLKSSDGKSVRFTIYDNGGQKVFRCIQNLFLKREGIYIVVFDIMRLVDNQSRNEALEHLDYWLSSIKLDASETERRDNLAAIYPPVILVGTHYDEFQTLKGDVEVGLKHINDTLIKHLPLANLAPLESAHNDSQGLCFWPIDNTNPLDLNISKLRQVLFHSAINDEGINVAQRVPISVLLAMDKLTEVSRDKPIIKILPTENSEEISVVKLMSEYGIFSNGFHNIGEKRKVCEALLEKYHKIGHFLYFSHLHSLRDYCILDPQWLIDMIAYIVRDFRYHWFHRDTSAIELNDGKSWNRLKDRGILELPLLRHLWIGSLDYMTFFIKLLLDIGIFGKCGDVFTVPLVPTFATEYAFKETIVKIGEYMEDLVQIGQVSVPEHSFVIGPFYCRLSNALTIDTFETVLFSSGCILFHHETGHEYSLLLDSTKKIIQIAISKSVAALDTEASGIISSVHNACINVNEKQYKSRLEISVTRLENHLGFESRIGKSSKRMHRYSPTSNDPEEEDETAFQKKLAADEVLRDQYMGLVQHFKTMTTPRKAEALAECILKVDNDISIATLQSWFHTHNDSNMFIKEILPSLGINELVDKMNISSVLDNLGPPPNATNYLIACIDEREFLKEQTLLRHKLASSNFVGHFVNLNGSWKDEVLRNCEKYSEFTTLLHFGAHKKTLEQSKVEVVLNDPTIKSQTKCCVLNSCQSKEVIGIVKDALPQETVIYWESNVDNEAAMRFSREFYGILCASEKNSRHFQHAFDKTKRMMDAHNFVFARNESILDREENGKIVAGLLRFWNGSKNEIEEEKKKKRKYGEDYGKKNTENQSEGDSIEPIDAIKKIRWPNEVEEGSTSIDSSSAIDWIGETKAKSGPGSKQSRQLLKCEHGAPCQQKFSIFFSDGSIMEKVHCKYITYEGKGSNRIKREAKNNSVARPFWKCSVCGMRLCKEKRFNVVSCFDVHDCNQMKGYVHTLNITRGTAAKSNLNFATSTTQGLDKDKWPDIEKWVENEQNDELNTLIQDASFL